MMAKSKHPLIRCRVVSMGEFTHKINTSDFDYDLPDDLIAQTPIKHRDQSKLMVLSRLTRQISHHKFYQITDHLLEDDVMVLNNTRVSPARFYGKRSDTGSPIELLLLEQISPGIWKTLVKPGKRMRNGASFEIIGQNHRLEGEVLDVDRDGSRIVKIEGQEFLNEIGVIPLPPYIRESLEDPDRYQTVYSSTLGSVAAPTAGLHFTDELLGTISELGVEIVYVTLHVGWGSFRPVDSEDPREHVLHSEAWELGKDAADKINLAKSDGRRIVSVGTTAVRLLEHVAIQSGGILQSGSGKVDLFILPGHQFKIVDALITNFHLPRSTLLMLTSAFGDRELILNAYRTAVSCRYRFYSFGDAMFVT